MSWTSPNGTPLTDHVIARVQLDVLAELYDAAMNSEYGTVPTALYNRANSATIHAWNLGYLNPKGV